MPIPITLPSEVVLQLIAIYQEWGDEGPPLSLLWVAMAYPLQSLPDSFFPSYRLMGFDPEVPHPEFLADIRELSEDLLVEVKDDRVSLTSVGRVLTIARELPESLKAMADNIGIIRLEMEQRKLLLGAYTDAHPGASENDLTTKVFCEHFLGGCGDCRAAYTARFEQFVEREKSR